MIKQKQSLSYAELAIHVLLGVLCLPVALVVGVALGALIGVALAVVFAIAAILTPFWASDKLLRPLFEKYDNNSNEQSSTGLLLYVTSVALLGVVIGPVVVPAVLALGLIVSLVVSPVMMLFITGALTMKGQDLIYITASNLLAKPEAKEEVVRVFESQSSFGEFPDNSSQGAPPYQPTGEGFLRNRRPSSHQPASARIESGKGTDTFNP